jgi:hypothetical protein
MEIRPGRIDPLAVYILPLVKHIVQNLDSQMGHANLIHIGKTDGKAYIHIYRIFFHHIHFIANVSGRFVHFQKYLII